MADKKKKRRLETLRRVTAQTLPLAVVQGIGLGIAKTIVEQAAKDPQYAAKAPALAKVIYPLTWAGSTVLGHQLGQKVDRRLNGES